MKFSGNMKRVDKLLVYCLLLFFCGGIIFLSNHNIRELLVTGKSLAVLSVILLFIIY